MTVTTAATRGASATSAEPGHRAVDGWVRDAVLLAFRLVIGFLFLLHVVMAYGLLGGIDGAGTPLPTFSFMWCVAVVQTVTVVMVAVGFHARPAAFLLSGIMAGAYFVGHAPTGWNPLQNMGEPAALFSWIFLLLCVVGTGRYAVDTLRAAR